ncbi:MAG: hypothetical protein J0M02_03850 [Planctomycetes bacterium]|nr:hypothetical protein [Planctomycetota bacterium]
MGKTPVRDWRACVRTWEARNRERTPVADPAGLTFTERAVTADEIRSMMNLPAQGLACG